MKKRYAFSLLAYRAGRYGIEVSHCAGVLIAKNEDEARGVAFRLAYEEYPQDKGYSNHSVSFCEIPRENEGKV